MSRTVSGTIALVATNGPRAVGGLSAYARHLGEELRATRPVLHVIRFPTDTRSSTAYGARLEVGEDATIVPGEALFDHRPAARPLAHLVGRAMHRPPTRRLAQLGHTWSLEPSLERAIPSSVSHLHWIGTGWELSGFAVAGQARRRGIPFSVWPAVHPGAWGDSQFDMTFYAQADAVLAQSEHERSLLIEAGIDEAKVHRMTLAPAVSATGDGRRLRHRLGLRDERLVLFVGRRDGYKGYDLLLRAMMTIWEAHPDVRVLACGPHGGQAAVKDPRVIDLGLVDESTKADAYAAADVFCLPSRFEAFGIAYVEAWSYGLPVVAGDCAAVAELVRDGKDGLLVAHSPEAVIRAILTLLEDDEARARMGAAGRERQKKEFTWNRVARMHQSVFARVEAEVSARS